MSFKNSVSGLLAISLHGVVVGLVAVSAGASAETGAALTQEFPPSLPALRALPKNPAPAAKAAPKNTSGNPAAASKSSPAGRPVQTGSGAVSGPPPLMLQPLAAPNPAKLPSDAPDSFQATATIQAPVDLLRAVPLEIGGYEIARHFPERLGTASQVLQAIDGAPNLLIHMEVLRRGYHQLGAGERDKLLTTLLSRQRAAQNDMIVAFDHGYAQLLFNRNKTGLFFLRKANDKLQTQFSSLAYAMAQAEADINIENVPADAMTTRKLDVIYKLTDAVNRDAGDHQPGFWPSYVRVIEKLKPLKAYDSFTRRDFSVAYVPYGNSVVPMGGATTVSLSLKSVPSDWASDLPSASSSSPLPSMVEAGGYQAGACDPAQADADSEGGGGPVLQKSVSFGVENALIRFFNTTEPALYRVQVTAADGRPMLSFRTYVKSGIVEDLEGDGTFEIVARQYQQSPMQPVIVYRYTPCGFERDRNIDDKFL